MILLSFSVSSHCQKNDTLYDYHITNEIDSNYFVFEKTKSYTIIRDFLLSEGFQLEDNLGESTITFRNLVTNENFIEKDIGIWKTGILIEYSKLYLLFKINDNYKFVRCSPFDTVLKEFKKFIKKVDYTEKQKTIALFGIVKYLNECNDYPIECFMDCY